MTATRIDDDHARVTYEAIAPHYDLFTAHHDYEGWTAIFERLARDAGLRGRRLLDVACGTGKSFLPFLARGYDVTACDVSPAMVAAAAAKCEGRARLLVHDMRSLPRLGAFDLVCCIDDAVNYLLDEAELAAAFVGMRANLAPGGVLVFDVNTLHTYRTAFATMAVVQEEGRVLVWDGLAADDSAPGCLAEAQLDALVRGDDGSWSRIRATHRQRHHPAAAITAALGEAGLVATARIGLQPSGETRPEADELADTKAMYVVHARAERR